MTTNRVWIGMTLALLTFATGCISDRVRHQANAMEYLYPRGAIKAPPDSVDLVLPLRVGLAFAPSQSETDTELSMPAMRELLKRVASAFKEVPELQDVVLLPTSSLTPKGGFDNLAGIAGMNGVSVVALVSFDQLQLNHQGHLSLLYWTIIGAYLVPADRQQTHTLLDVAVLDVASRALLLTGSGSSVVKARSTAVGAGQVRRDQSVLGFEQATDDMISSLKGTLEVFRENARNGTVRGLGTPTVHVQRPDKLTSGGSGVGALGVFEVAASLLLVGAAALLQRRRAA
jgi:rhombotail lipoprotein